MKCRDVIPVMGRIAAVMEANSDYLSELDARNGDGDLGITMKNGFHSAARAMKEEDTEDFGRLFLVGSQAFNLAAPSTLGTILSFGMMGMARDLKGKTEICLSELAGSMEAGLGVIMEKGGAKPGEKTILDALVPAVRELKETAGSSWERAAEAARRGMENTKGMRPVHGRAAYYGEKNIGLVDGGAVAGMLIVECIADYVRHLK